MFGPTLTPIDFGSSGGGGSPPASTVLRNTYDIALYGSSSTSGNQDLTGVTPASVIVAGTDPASTKVVQNYGAGGATFDTGGSQVLTQISGSAYKSGGQIVQFDNNTTFYVGGTNYGSPEVRRVSVINNAVPLFNAGVMSGKRALFWLGTEPAGSSGYSSNYFKNVRAQELLWADYPGQVVNALEYWHIATPADANDRADQLARSILRSYQISDRSHLNQLGYQYRCGAKIDVRFAEAINSGPAYFPFNRYYSVASTAQTNGGAVLTLSFIGDLTGTTLTLLNRDQTANADFTINSTTAAVTRASGTQIKLGVTDLLVKVSRSGYTDRYDAISISIGNLTNAITEMTVDGYLMGILETNDNAGTPSAPSFPSTTRQWAGIGATTPEMSQVFMLAPDASMDGVTITAMSYQSCAMTRLSTGAYRVLTRDNGGVTLGQRTGNTGPTTGRMNGADGRRVCFYSANQTAGVHRLIICDYADVGGTPLYDSTWVAIAGGTDGATVCQHGLASAGTPLYIFAAISPNPGTTNFKGIVGLMWAANKAIDFGVAANRTAFYQASNAGPADFSATDAAHPGDNRSIIVQAGGNAYNVGATVTPYMMLDGHAGNFHAGKNRGTGGNFVSMAMRDPTGSLPNQGIGITA